MILYTGVALITILLGLCINRESCNFNTTRQQLMNKICLAAIFCVLFLLCAFRVGVGNDYTSYVQNAHEIIKNGITVTEPGYNFVVKALYIISGWENVFLVFAFFGFCTIFMFMKSMYEQSEWFAMSFILFMALGIYFRSFSTVRYYLVLAITLYSLKYVINKEHGKFVLLIVLAAFFHKSVLVVIPMYFICNRPWKKWFYGIVAVGTVVLYALKDVIMEIALKIYPSYKDTIYLTMDTGLKSNLPGIFRCLVVIAFCIIFYKEAIKDNKANTLYFNMSVMAVALYVGGSFIPMVSRFGYYLITAQIILVPGVYKFVDKKKQKLVLICIMGIAALYFAYFLYTASKPGVQVLPYKTWFFNELEWENVEEMRIYTRR